MKFGKICIRDRFMHYGSTYEKVSDHHAKLILDNERKRPGPTVRFDKRTKVQELPK